MADKILINDVCKKFGINEIKHFFDIKPIAAPRMTHRDKWAHRKCVDNYYAYRNELFVSAYNQRYSINYKLNIIFVLPYPDSWGQKKKIENYLMPCLVKPDIDNLIKAFLDGLKKNDQEIWAINAMKIYSEYGCILIF